MISDKTILFHLDKKLINIESDDEFIDDMDIYHEDSGVYILVLFINIIFIILYFIYEKRF